MDIQSYINSGILELYILNLLSDDERTAVDLLLIKHEVLAEEVAKIAIALEKYAMQNAIEPKAHIKLALLKKIENQEKEKAMDPLNLPEINKYTTYKNWLNFINTVGKTPIGPDGKAIQVLTNNENITQLYIESTSDFETEVHEREHESFLILSGQCLCTIGGETRLMSKGDFMQIPLYAPHDVKLVSEKVTAILQRIRV